MAALPQVGFCDA